MRAGDPDFDVTVALPELAPLRRLAADGDYDALADLLLDLNDRDEASMTVATQVVADVAGVEEVLERRLSEDPGDFLARTLLAHRRIRRAWEARGGGMATTVSDAAYDTFFGQLRLAEQDLIRVCAEDPGWSPPWVLRLMTARGLELGVGETRRRYVRLTRLDPHHYAGQAQLLQRLCPKWGGTWEDAFGFVRSNASEAPSGSPVAALVAMAHLERAVDLPSGEGESYLADPNVRHDLKVAAEASVFSPRATAGLHTVHAHTLLGIAQALAGEKEEAGRHFRALGPVVDEGLWRYLGRSAAKVEKVRSAALRKG